MSRQRWNRSKVSGPLGAGGAGGEGAAGGAAALLVFLAAMSEVQILEPLEIALQRRELGLVHLGLDRLDERRPAAAPDLAQDRRDPPCLAHLEGGERAPERDHGATEVVVVERFDEHAHRAPQRLLGEKRIAVARR